MSEKLYYVATNSKLYCHCSRCGRNVFQDMNDMRYHSLQCGLDEKWLKPYNQLAFDETNNKAYELRAVNGNLIISIYSLGLQFLHGRCMGGKKQLIYSVALQPNSRDIEVYINNSEPFFDSINADFPWKKCMEDQEKDDLVHWIRLIEELQMVKLHQEKDETIVCSTFPMLLDIASLDMFVWIYLEKGYYGKSPLSESQSSRYFKNLENRKFSCNDVICIDEALKKSEKESEKEDKKGSLFYFCAKLLNRKEGNLLKLELHYINAYEWSGKLKKNNFYTRMLDKQRKKVEHEHVGFLFGENGMYATRKHLELNKYLLQGIPATMNQATREALLEFDTNYPQFCIRSFLESGGNNVLLPLLSGEYHKGMELFSKSGCGCLTDNLLNLNSGILYYVKLPMKYHNLKQLTNFTLKQLQKINEVCKAKKDNCEYLLVSAKIARNVGDQYGINILNSDSFSEQAIDFFDDYLQIYNRYDWQPKELLRVLSYLTNHGVDYNLYRDYFRACMEIGEFSYGITPKNEEMQKAHDEIMEKQYFERFYRANKHKEIAFVNAVSKYADMAKDDEGNSYHNEQFMLTIPNSPMDLFEESKALHHCVKTYVDTVINSGVQIYFLRHCSCPEVPYATIEVCDGKVKQLKACFNQKASVEAMQFVIKWAIAKKLSIVTSDIALSLQDAG